MACIDYGIVIIYFAFMIGLGFAYKKRASQDLESYFLGGKRLSWLPLAMSGSVSNFDITGTMWIVSILFLLGMKSMWHHWMWGFLMGAFFLAYMGKWVRRSKVMTAAEWMRTRFGENNAGKVARTAYAVMAILTQASFLGYAYQGIGKFASVYIPLDSLAEHVNALWLKRLFIDYQADVLAALIIGVTTLYVILGGLYSVVVTDVIQTIILTMASVFIAGTAWLRLNPEALKGLPDGFASLRIPWKIPEFSGTENASFEWFGALVIVWFLKGLLMNAGGPAQMYDFQRFLAAKNERDAAKIGAAWSVFLVVRWAMAMGIVLIALTGIAGVQDSEKVMPLVLKDFLPIGIRGVVIAGLLAAFMSTFSSTVNSGASFIVRDIWQPFFGRNAGDKKAVRFSHTATVLLVLLGLIIGVRMMMALGAGVIIPNVLRWYWWRMNGWGYAYGTLGGILLSVISLLFPGTPQYVVFPLVVMGSLLMSVGGSLLTKPVEERILTEFYLTVRPFGAWRKVRLKAGLSLQDRDKKSEKASRAILNVILGMAAISAGYLFPMYLVGHWYLYAAVCFIIMASAVLALRYTWYKNLMEN